MRPALPILLARAQYSEYLRRLNARAVLDHYGIRNDHDEVTDRGETEVIHSCLLDQVDRHHHNGDQNPSAACNLDRKLYVCYAYWGGDLFHLVQKMEDKSSFEEILPIVEPWLEGSVVPPDQFAAEIEAALANPHVSPEFMPAYSDRVLSPWAFVHPYLHERGIDSDTASRLQIGWREDDNRIIIPHFWQGKLVGWQSRAIPGEDKSTFPPTPYPWPPTAQPNPKYKSTSGFPKSETFYYDHSRGFPRPGSKAVVVVESPFSVIKATALGLDTPVLATFGSKVSPVQTEMLKSFDRVTVWADPDPAGETMERTLLRRLHNHPGLEFVIPDPGRDMADCDTLAEIEDKIGNSELGMLRAL